MATKITLLKIENVFTILIKFVVLVLMRINRKNGG